MVILHKLLLDKLYVLFKFLKTKKILNKFLLQPIPPPMAPQAPPPPPAFAAGGFTNIVSPPQPPAAPPAPAMPINTGGGPPPPAPPPPPPMGGLGKPEGLDMNSLASQLQAAKLKRNQKTTPPPPAENSGSSTSSGGSGNYGTIGRSSNGMASMMDEMAKTLARRRAVVDKKPEVCIFFLI